MNIPKVAIFDMDGLIFNTERQFFKFERWFIRNMAILQELKILPKH